MVTSVSVSTSNKQASSQFIASKLDFQLLLSLTLVAQFNINNIADWQEINAAVINISGRQRMLSQQAALYALRLVSTSDQEEQEKLCQNLLGVVALMSKSHQGLIHGNSSLNLPGEPSLALKRIYYEAPINLEQQIQDYLHAIKSLVESKRENWNLDNLHLKYILDVSSESKILLKSLDIAVSQYQKEKEAQESSVYLEQAELIRQSRLAEKKACQQAEKIQNALANLKTTQTQLIQAEKMSSLGQLVAGVAHEINNPLTFISANVDYAQSYTQDLLDILELYQKHYPQPKEEIKDKIEDLELDYLIQDLPKILNSMSLGTGRIEQIVLNLRKFSRQEEATRKKVDIHEGINNTLLILRHRLKARGKRPEIKVIKNYGKLPLINCFPSQLNQVFMNIISNAIDALEEECKLNDQFTKPQIHLRTKLQNNDAIAIIIKDNGGGINTSVQERLFEPFFTTKPVGKGTGLGLSISHQIIVKYHRGIIKCKSAPGEGTEFWIEIPIDPDREMGKQEV
ncbi:MAG: ATP-binding protein [Spirulinaceae cyanobacterium]